MSEQGKTSPDQQVQGQQAQQELQHLLDQAYKMPGVAEAMAAYDKLSTHANVSIPQPTVRMTYSTTGNS